MIQMISGYTRWEKQTIGPKDGPVSLDENAEARLVSLGVAEYVTDSPSAPAGGDSTDNDGVSPASAEIGAEAATEGVTAQYEPGKIDSTKDRAPLIVGDDCAENVIMQGTPDESGEILPAIGIEDMSFAQLKAVAEQMGIETKGMRSKAALISAIENAKPPDLKVME